MVAVKIGAGRQIIIPKRIYDELGLAPGDYLDFERRGCKLILIPRTFVEQRLAESFEDFRRGRVHGPFTSAKEAIQYLRKSRKGRRR